MSGELLQNAMALHQAGNACAAEAIYREILKSDSRNARALSLLGMARAQQGCWEEGVGYMESSLGINPNQPDVLNNLGGCLQHLGKHGEARAKFEQALKLHPGYAGAYFNLGNVLHDLEHHEEAAASYRKVISLRPDYAEAHVNLGNSLMEMKLYEEALDSCDKALALVPGRADVYFNRGLVLHELGRHEEALASYDRVIELEPSLLDAYVHRASALIDLGLLEEAKDSLTEALRFDPDYVPSLYQLCMLGDEAGRDENFGQLQTLYARREQLSEKNRISLNFVMGKALERKERFDEAFQAYEEGNRFYRMEHPYDASAEEKSLEWITSLFTRELIGKCSEISAALPAPQDERVPVFIVGMPRSGSTLIEQMLASHPAIMGAGEVKAMEELVRRLKDVRLDPSSPEKLVSSLRSIGRDYLDEVWRLAPDAAYISDKFLYNYRYLGLIYLMFPRARVVHAVRNPADTCVSCYATLFDEGNGYAYDLEALGRHYLRYEGLMAHWRNVLPAGWVLDVRYEDMVAAPEDEVGRLLEYLGLPWDNACLRFHETRRVVQTASRVQVRQPIYSGSVARWKRFEKHLGPLLELIGVPN